MLVEYIFVVYMEKKQAIFAPEEQLHIVYCHLIELKQVTVFTHKHGSVCVNQTGGTYTLG